MVWNSLSQRILEWIAFPFPRDLPNPRIEPRSPTLQADPLPAEPQGKSLVDVSFSYKVNEELETIS